jgi:hypothetical protein
MKSLINNARCDNYRINKIHTCAIVQGNIRNGIHDILIFLAGKFDSVILSTWTDEAPESIPYGSWEVIQSDKPSVAGYSHRNFQRFSTAAGIRRAKELQATHILKWRTDMLPTRLSVSQLLEWSNFQVPEGLASRLVTCAFRNLTVKQDWFSTMPDLFAFGDISLMEMLWGDEGFDYSLPMNIPKAMLAEYGDSWINQTNSDGLYAAETELYAIFKAKLQHYLNRSLLHEQVAKNYMRLFDHKLLGICWFGQPGKFRTITQALQHPWWTEAIWKDGTPKTSEWGYPEDTLLQKLRCKYLTRWVQKRELKYQAKNYKEWLNKTQ